MPDLSLTEIVDLLEKSNSLGIKLSLSNDEMIIHIQKGKMIDPSFLTELKNKKEHLIGYFKSYRQKKVMTLSPLVNPVLWNGKVLYEIIPQQKKEIVRFQIIGKYAHNLSFKILFRDLDESVLESAIDCIFERHESLRTAYAIHEGEIWQFIHESRPPGFSVEYFDLTRRDNREERIRELQSEDANQLTDFEKGPFVHLKVIKQDAHRSMLLFKISHLISDAHSLDILHREITTVYTALKEGKENPLPPLACQYKEYGAWINEFLKGDEGEECRRFYKRTISESLTKNKGVFSSYKDKLGEEIRALTKRENIEEFDLAFGLVVNLDPPPGYGYKKFIGANLLIKLKKLALDCNTSFFIVLASTISLVYNRIKNEPCVRLFTPMSTRIFEEFDGVVGWLVGEMVICVEFVDGISMIDLVRSVAFKMEEAMSFRFYPYERILQDLDISLSALSPVFINHMDKTGQVIEDFNSFHYSGIPGHFDLKCVVAEYDNGLELDICYCRHAFSREQIGIAFDAYPEMLENITNHPGYPVRL
ncbi:condensation domain-containing protein [Flavitalea flava]